MKILQFALLIFVAVLPASAQSRASRNKPLMDMIAALGGETFLNAREIHTTGRFFSFQRGELTGGDIFVDYIKLPEMERTEFGREKAKSVQINKGEEGWTITGKDGAEVEAMLFSHTAPLPARVRAVYRLGINEYNGAQKLQVTIEHWQPV